MNPSQLLAHFDRISEAPDAIPRLRRFILDLAVQGQLARALRWPERPAPLGGVATLQNGYAFKSEWFTPTGIRLLRNVNVGHDEMRWDDVACLPVSRASEFDRFRLAEGDIVLSLDRPFIVTGTKVARVRREDLPCLLLQRVGRFQLRVDRLSPDYLFLWLHSPHFYNQIDPGRSNGVPHVSSKQVEAAEIFLPPLAEQRRTVAKVDELMALCDRLEAAQAERGSRRDRLVAASLSRLNEPAADDAQSFRDHARFHLHHLPRLTTRPEHIQRLRQTILNLAVRGQLVEQDSHDEPATELLKRIQVEKARLVRDGNLPRQRDPMAAAGEEPSFPVPAGWAVATLGQLSLKITDGTHRTPSYVDEGIPFISVKDFSGGALDFSSTRFISPEEHAVLCKRCDPRRGDILIGRIGTLGKAVLVDTDREFSLFVSVGLIRFAHDLVVPAFLRLLLNSPQAGAEFDRIKIGGATHTNKLNLGDLHTVLLPLPPLGEQHRIVAKVDELMALCDRLEAQLTTGQTESRRLLEAVL